MKVFTNTSVYAPCSILYDLHMGVVVCARFISISGHMFCCVVPFAKAGHNCSLDDAVRTRLNTGQKFLLVKN